MKKTRFNKPDMAIINKIKSDIEELIGFKVNSNEASDAMQKSNSFRRKFSPAASPKNRTDPIISDSFVRSPRQNHSATRVKSRSVTIQQPVTIKIKPTISPKTSSRLETPRKSEGGRKQLGLQKKQSVKQQGIEKKQRLKLNKQENFKQEGDRQYSNPSADKLCKKSRSSVSQANPYFLLDMRLNQLVDRVDKLRQTPQINKNSKELYGIVGRVRRSNEQFLAYNKNKVRRQQFQRQLKERNVD